MAPASPRLGQLLIAAGLIDDSTLELALKAQVGSGRRLGEVLVRDGHVQEGQLTQVLSMQFSVAWVSLSHVDFTRALLDMLSGELAHLHTAIPVHARKDAEGRRILYVAMDDPTNVDAMREISAFADMNVRPLIAPPSELQRAITSHYGPPVEMSTSRLSQAG